MVQYRATAMISEAEGWIFIHIQKTGGYSIRTALGHGVTLEDPNTHALGRELRSIYGEEAWQRCFKFAFVRNPWDRMVSWWSMIDRFRRGEHPLAGSNKFFLYVLERAATFEQFLTNCGDIVHDRDGTKWIYRNQIDYVTDADGHIMLDFIGRFENLTADFELVSKRISLGDTKLPHQNRSNHKDYVTYYTPATRDLVGTRFERDLNAFGYRFGE